MAETSIHEEEALGKAYDARLMRRLLGYVRPYRRLVVGALALLFGDGALQLVGPFLTRRVIDVALPAGDLGMVRTAALLYLASLVLQFAFSYGETLLTSLLGQRVMRDLRIEIFAHLQRLSIAFVDRNPVGRLITRVTSDVEALNELFTAGVVAGLGDLFTLLAISIAMLIVDWRLAMAAFVVIPLVVLTRTCSGCVSGSRTGRSGHGSRGSTRFCRSGSPAFGWCSSSAGSVRRQIDSTRSIATTSMRT